MRWRTRSLIATGLSLTMAAPAWACGFPFNSAFLAVPESPTFGVGLQNWFTDYTLRTLTADASLKVGEKVVVRPGVGMCSEEIGDGTESNILFGASAAMPIWTDEAGKMTVNVQAGFEMVSYDGASWRNIPVGAAIQSKSSETMSLFAGAVINLSNFSVDNCDDCGGSNSDPALFGGAVFGMGNINLTAGGTIWMGDDTDFALNLSANMSMGSTMSGLKKIRSLFRK